MDIKAVRAASQPTIDPTQIQGSSGIPPTGAQYTGLSPQGQVDVYCGTLSGDIDAAPSAKELLSASPDTGGASNADYIYNQMSKLYGGVQLPSFQSPNGNNVKSLVFVSGSAQGPFGAFHINDADQAGFDRIVTDSINAQGNYSNGSGLNTPSTTGGNGMRPAPFFLYRGPNNLYTIKDAKDPAVASSSKKQIEDALAVQQQSSAALAASLFTGNNSTLAYSQLMPKIDSAKSKDELVQQLVRANQNVQALSSAVAAANPGRQYLSTALFAAELTESFEQQSGTANAGQTDGEAISRVAAFKLAPEIALVPGFNTGVTQQWWQDGHPDWVNNNSQNDQSTDGNAAGVMFLQFMNDYLGVPLDQIVQHMPVTQGAAGSPLGQTYTNLLKDYPQLAQKVGLLAGNGATGQTGQDAFNAMINLLTNNDQTSNGTLNLPANGNPFTSMPGAASGGLFASASGNGGTTPNTSANDLKTALQQEGGVEQQLAQLKATLQKMQQAAQSAGGNGAKVGIIELGGNVSDADLKAYLAKNEISMPEIKVVSVDPSADEAGEGLLKSGNTYSG